MTRSFSAFSTGLLFAAGIGAAQAADVDTETGPAIRFLLESQSGYSFLDGDQLDSDEEDDFSSTGGVGRMNIQATDVLNMQFDVFGDYAWIDGNDGDYQSSIGGAGHLYLRNDMGAIGLFGSYGDTDIDGSQGGGGSWIAGAEGQMYFDNMTLQLQAGYLDSSRSDDDNMIRDAGFVRGLGRYYFAPSTLLQAEVAYAAGEMDSDNDDVDIFTVGARLQHRFDFWPGAFYIGYRGDFADQQSEGKLDSHTILFGSTYVFGSDSLQDNERNGAAWDLPQYLRWQGIAAGPLE